MDTYQVVSEHSILGAQMETSHGKSEAEEVEQRMEYMEGIITQLEEINQYWKRRTKRDGRRSRRDHAPCRRRSEKVSEKDFEIYLDMRLQWLQQSYVTPPSRATKKEAEKEPEEEEEMNEEFKLDLNFQNEAVVVTNQNQQREDEPEKENKEEVKPEVETRCSHNQCKQFFYLVKEECALDAGKEESKPAEELEEVDMGGADWESLTEEQPPEPPEPPDGGVFKGGSRSLVIVKREADDKESPVTATINRTTAATAPSVHELEEPSVFLVDEMYDRGKEEERSCGKDQPTAPSRNETVAVVRTLREVGDAFFSLTAVDCDTEKEKRVRIGSGSWLVDLRAITLGQAHLLVSNSDYSCMKWGVLKAAKEIKNNNPHLCAILACVFTCNWEPKNTNMLSEASQVNHSMGKQAEVLVTEVPNTNYVT